MKQFNEMLEYRKENPPEEPKFSVKTLMRQRMQVQMVNYRQKIKHTLGTKHLKRKMCLLFILLIAQMVMVKRIRGWGKKIGMVCGFVGTLGGLGVNFGLWRFRRSLN